MHLKDMPVDSVSVSSATFSLYINGGDARGRSQLASRESGLALGEPTQRAIKWADVAAANAAACHIPPEVSLVLSLLDTATMGGQARHWACVCAAFVLDP